jgi:manganese/iron transport system substrate-binding protein
VFKKIFCLLLLALLTSCSNKSSEPQAIGQKPLVVVTTDVLCDITKQIAKDTVDLKCLMAAGTDPHSYQATPADRQAIEKANLVLYAGYDFEPTPIKIIRATSKSVVKVAVNEVAVPKPLTESDAQHSHDPHDSNSQQNHDPHVWHNAKNGIAMAQTIETSLSQLLPANRSTYKQNTQTLTDLLSKIDDWIKNQVTTIPTNARKLVTTHDALGYYSHAYELPIEGALQGFSTEEKPTAQRVAKLVDSIKKSGVPTIFTEISSSSKLLTSIAKDAKVRVSTVSLLTDGLGLPGSRGDTYPKMLIANTETIVKGLGGKFQSFGAIALPSENSK